MTDDMKNCGDCHECCHLPAIKPLVKEDFKTCGNLCKHDGCTIYKDRPIPCRAFNCLWRVNKVMDWQLRPDRCGVMFEMFPTEKTVIALMRPDAVWQKGPVKQLLDRMVGDGYCVWLIRKKDGVKERNIILPDGVTEKTAYARAIKIGQRVDIEPEEVEQVA